MHRGRIVESGLTDVILHTPASDYARQLLAPFPAPAGNQPAALPRPDAHERLLQEGGLSGSGSGLVWVRRMRCSRSCIT